MTETIIEKLFVDRIGWCKLIADYPYYNHDDIKVRIEVLPRYEWGVGVKD